MSLTFKTFTFICLQTIIWDSIPFFPTYIMGLTQLFLDLYIQINFIINFIFMHGLCFFLSPKDICCRNSSTLVYSACHGTKNIHLNKIFKKVKQRAYHLPQCKCLVTAGPRLWLFATLCHKEHS